MSTTLSYRKVDIRASKQPVEPRTLRSLAIRICRACNHHSAVLEQNTDRVQRVLQKRRESKQSISSKSHDTHAQVLSPGLGEAPCSTAVSRSQAWSLQDSKSNEDAGRGPYVLSDQQLLRFERLGHTCTRSLFDEAEVSALHRLVQKEIESRQLAALRHRIRVLLPPDKHVPVHGKEQALRHLRKHSQELGFLQFFNLHRDVPLVRNIVTSQRLASVAAQLLGEKRIRVYQDCVFVKEPGFTPTNWHSDLPLSPLDTNSFVTAWIPLRPLKRIGDSGLEFAERSHRDIAVHVQKDGRSRDLSDRGYRIRSVGKMDVGDVSWHHGWLLHYAPPQPLNTPPRIALAVSFFADGARIRQSEWSGDDCMLEDKESYADWLGLGLGKLHPGAVARHTLLPLIELN